MPAHGLLTRRATTEAGLILVIVPFLAFLLWSCEPAEHRRPDVSAASRPADDKIEAPPPPLSDGIFPCTECHDPAIPVNTKRRPMKVTHEQIVFKHDEEHRWCLDCHAEKDRDKLHLASGELIEFTESYRLCGQCHGDKYRDWRAGVHGRRTGSWNGHKTYLLCVHCHNSHAPAFKPLAPLPPPRRPAGDIQ